MKRTRIITIALALSLGGTIVGPVGPAVAAPSTANATQRGWYASNGNTSGFNDNYCVGRQCWGSGIDTNNYFVFDLTSYAGQASTLGVGSANIVLSNPSGLGVPRPFVLRHVSTPIGDLYVDRPIGSGRGKDIFQELATGTEYASDTVVSVSQNPVEIGLNAEGRLALTKALGGMLALGGSLEGDTADDLLFGSSGAVAVDGVQIQFFFGPKTQTSVRGPRSVERGTKATFRGSVSSADAICLETGLEVHVGSTERFVGTDVDGDYSFQAKITKKTKIRVVNTGWAFAANCGPSAVNKTVKVV